MHVSEDRQHIEVEDGGRVVAVADLQVDPPSRTMRAQLHVVAGHHRPGTGEDLVDAVLARAAAEQVMRLEATVPAGEAEVLTRLQERCGDLRTRPAGATVLVEADLRDPRPGRQEETAATP
jgi:hypothetical protein